MKKRLTIGAIVGNSNLPYMRDVMKGIESACAKYDHNLIYLLGFHMAPTFYSHFEDSVKFDYDYQYNVVYDYALLSGCDVLILSYGTISMFMENVDKAKFLEKFSSIPYILLLDRDESNRGSSLMSNNYEGMRRLVEHLVLIHKYKKFAYLGGPQNNKDAEERLQGFKDVLTRYEIPFEEKNFAYGDYTFYVENQICMLLDNNPDVEALVCANDLMADTAYKVCADRGLKVGIDIAITGYDDWEMASKMNPPLTTITQSGFDSGYLAVEEAMALFESKTGVEKYIPTAVKIRNSCGCPSHETGHFFTLKEISDAQKETYIDGLTRLLVGKAMISTANKDIQIHVETLIRPLIAEIIEEVSRCDEKPIDKNNLTQRLTEIMLHSDSVYFSFPALCEAMGNTLMNRIKHEPDDERIRAYAAIMSVIQNFVQANTEKSHGEKMTYYQNDTMFMPYISLDMISHIDDVKSFYHSTMSTLATMGIKTAYLFTLKEPVKHDKEDTWQLPDALNLVACQRDHHIVVYDTHERPVLSKHCKLTEYLFRKDRYIINIFDVFMGENQYGILVAETESSNALLMNLACQQISSAINFRRLYMAQKDLRNTLESTVNELKEKNRILGFISEYDQMTGCLNRRGLAERVQTLLHEKEGQKAIVVLADLDHLKEINDYFGHTEGDFAIKGAATILQQTFGKSTILSRIGGDEFMAFFLPDQASLTANALKKKIDVNNKFFNESANKPYYVDLSVGCYDYICNPRQTLQDLMDMADRLLYEDKEGRRDSVLKDNL